MRICCQTGRTESLRSWFPAFPVPCERRLISASRFVDSAQHLETVRKITAAPIARVLVLRRFREIDCSIEPANRFFVPSQTGEQKAESVCGYRFEQQKARTRLRSCLVCSSSAWKTRSASWTAV